MSCHVVDTRCGVDVDPSYWIRGCPVVGAFTHMSLALTSRRHALVAVYLATQRGAEQAEQAERRAKRPASCVCVLNPRTPPRQVIFDGQSGDADGDCCESPLARPPLPVSITVLAP
jgi:hypothetical protein